MAARRLAAPLLALLLLASSLPTALAQRASGSGAVTGTVADADTDAPLPTATVALWQAADGDSTLVTGATADLDGAFTIANVPVGTYDVRVSFVGYDGLQRRDVAVERGANDLGTLALEPTVATKEGVTVTAERRQVEVQFDRTVYNTADSPVTTGGSATDVLETLPSVTVDIEGNVSLRGTGSVRVLINGRPAPVGPELLASYLSQLPADSIERVEVIPNPSARYEPEGVGGIINIVLKQEADAGLTGTLASGVTSLGGVEGTASLGYGAGPWNLQATYGIETENGVGGGTSFRINRYESATPNALDQVETEDEDEFSQFGSATLGYALSDRAELTASGQFSTRDDTEIEANTYDLLSFEDALLRAYERRVSENDDGWEAAGRLGFDYDFGAQTNPAQAGRGRRTIEHALRVEGQYAFSTNDETVAARLFGEAPDDLAPQDVTEDRDRTELTVSLDYVRPLAGGRFEAGARADLERLSQALLAQTNGVVDVNESNTFNFDEDVWAAYLQGAREIGPLDVQLGLRGEIARTNFDLLTTGESNERSYASLFPSAFLGLALTDDDEVKLSYSRRIDRPSTWRLNPFPSFDDPFNVRQGNPALTPEYIDAIEAGYVRYTPWGSLTATAYYRRTTDVIQRVQTLCGSTASPLCAGFDDGVTVRSYENRASSGSTGLEAVFNVEDVLGGLGGYLSVEGFRVSTDGPSTGTGLAADGFGWGGRLNVTYGLPPTFFGTAPTLQVSARYRAPIRSESGRRGAFTFIDAALQQRFLDERASLTLRFRDPFRLAGFSYVVDRADLYQRFERDWGAQQVGVVFRYAFGQKLQEERRRGGGGGGDE